MRSCGRSTQRSRGAVSCNPFVRGLAEGTLDREVFKRYIDQDAFFLRAFLRAYALAAAKTDDLAQVRLFHRLMLGVLDELKLHADYAEKLGSNARDVKPYPATSAYTSFFAPYGLARTPGRNRGGDGAVHASLYLSRE